MPSAVSAATTVATAPPSDPVVRAAPSAAPTSTFGAVLTRAVDVGVGPATRAAAETAGRSPVGFDPDLDAVDEVDVAAQAVFVAGLVTVPLPPPDPAAVAQAVPLTADRVTGTPAPADGQPVPAETTGTEQVRQRLGLPAQTAPQPPGATPVPPAPPQPPAAPPTAPATTSPPPAVAELPAAPVADGTTPAVTGRGPTPAVPAQAPVVTGLYPPPVVPPVLADDATPAPVAAADAVPALPDVAVGDRPAAATEPFVAADAPRLAGIVGAVTPPGEFAAALVAVPSSEPAVKPASPDDISTEPAADGPTPPIAPPAGPFTDTVIAPPPPVARPAAPPAVEQVADGILDHARLLGRPGETEFRLRLDPADLGRVQVQLIADANGVRGRLTVADDAVRQMIESRLPELRDRLEAAGLSVQRFEVATDAGRGGGGATYHEWAGPPAEPLPPPAGTAYPTRHTRPTPGAAGVDVTV